jgi:hypothetical protein
MDEIHNVTLLKQLAKQAEQLNQPHLTSNPHWQKAYSQLAHGASLLWRLLEQSGPSGKLELADK